MPPLGPAVSAELERLRLEAAKDAQERSAEVPASTAAPAAPGPEEPRPEPTAAATAAPMQVVHGYESVEDLFCVLELPEVRDMAVPGRREMGEVDYSTGTGMESESEGHRSGAGFPLQNVAPSPAAAVQAPVLMRRGRRHRMAGTTRTKRWFSTDWRGLRGRLRKRSRTRRSWRRRCQGCQQAPLAAPSSTPTSPLWIWIARWRSFGRLRCRARR